MSHEIAAIYESGVIRPLEPVDWPEGTAVVVKAEAAAPQAVDGRHRCAQRAWGEYIEWMETLPDRSSHNGRPRRAPDPVGRPIEDG